VQEGCEDIPRNLQFVSSHKGGLLTFEHV
jgi:hypothetical protein